MSANRAAIAAMLERGARHLPNLVRRQSQMDLLLGFFLFIFAFALYARTLVPSFLDGDQGEFQYVPAILGIPHPTGFPLYILLGHLWSLLPIGNLAYRMNLFSAFWGASTIGALFVVLRRQNLHIVAAAGSALTLAVIPEFWLFSAAAAVYRLHDLLIVLLFGFLAEWEKTRDGKFLSLAALVFGFDLSNHLTILFFAPLTVAFVLLVGGRNLFTQHGVLITSALLLVFPTILYVYFPLRASQLSINDLVLPDWSKAVAQGIVSSHYENDPGVSSILLAVGLFSTMSPVTGFGNGIP